MVIISVLLGTGNVFGNLLIRSKKTSQISMKFNKSKVLICCGENYHKITC